MIIQIDTRESANQINHITDYFDKQGIKHFRSKMFVGDFMEMSNPRLCIDRKKNLAELAGNVCQQHARFKAEIMRARELDIKLVFLVEHGGAIQTIDCVHKWQNPRLKTSPKAITGERLWRTLNTIQNRYGVEFVYCDKKDTGRMIIELLGG